MMVKLITVIIALFIFNNLNAQENTKITGPIEYVYDSTKVGGLKAYVFFPDDKDQMKNHPAIVIFHGGGYTIGEASWAFWLAERYARKGMVAIAAQYRLSDKKSITPLDAMDDACNVIIWMRKNAKELKVENDKIIALGWSVGAHLASGTAVFPKVDSDNSITSIPNALVLVSPLLWLKNDVWIEKLLMGKGKPEDISPAEHLKGNMPPSIIVVGKDDTVTPIQQSKLFHENMQKYGNESYLNIYEGVGHLFTPSSQPDNEWPNPDKVIEAKAYNEIDLFIKKQGYTE